ncbi:MAG: DUF6318 family protein [Janibacter sp.]
MHTTRGAALLAAAALTVSGLAACGDEGEPTESSSTASPSAVGDGSSSESSSDSESSSSSESQDTKGDGKAVELPAAAKKHTKAGAEAFGKYYHQAYGDAAESGDISAIKELRDSGCKACLAGEKQISDDAKQGWKRDRNPYSYQGLKATKRSDSGHKVTMTVKAKKHYRVDEEGEPNATVDPVSFTLDEHVVWRNGQWVMLSWVATPK